MSKKKDEVSKKKEGVSKKEHNMKIVVKDNKDELCVQEYEDMCYTPIRVDTIEMGTFCRIIRKQLIFILFIGNDYYKVSYQRQY